MIRQIAPERAMRIVLSPCVKVVHLVFPMVAAHRVILSTRDPLPFPTEPPSVPPQVAPFSNR